MRKMRRFLYLLLLMTLIISCSDDSYRKQLNDIEQLLKQQKNEEACKLLNNMNPEELEDNEDVYALYWLLKMQVDVRLGNPIKSIDPLRHSVKYYEKINDYERLIWTYYYMGFVLDDLDQRPEAVVYLKKGESLALKNQESHKDILHHIYQCLTYMNLNAKEYDIAKHYGLLALKYVHSLNSPTNEANDLLSMSNVYSETGNKDSSWYYITRLLPLIDSLPEKKRPTYIGNIGIELKGYDNEAAKKYLLKSIETGDDPYFCKSLAKIYAAEGDKVKAFEMWHKALNTKDLSLKANVVKDMAKAKKEEGDYKAAHELSLWSAALKDSLHRQQKEENIKGQQELFDKERANEQLREERGHAIWMVAILALLIAALAAWTIYKKRKNSRRMNALNEELEQKDSAIEQLQQENEQKGKELERLSRDMTGYEEKHEKLLAAGQRLYEEIVGGGNTLKWEKEDFVHFVRYYKLKHADFVRHLENDYDELTARQKVFMILYDMGMTDEDVMRTLVLSETSIRVNKTRIKGKKLSSDKSEEETVN